MRRLEDLTSQKAPEAAAYKSEKNSIPEGKLPKNENKK
jgi:hypothetical protein